jgi:hypothetical protein
MALMALTGCGSDRQIVSGKLIHRGQPLTYFYPGLIEVFFVPLEGEVRDMYPAAVDPDGTFEVRGKDGLGLAPGRYRICVSQRRLYPHGPDLLRGQFTLTRSRIIRDIPTKEEITIDVGNPEG